ncbi:MAG: nucleotide-binding protein [Methanomicrobiales archaeon]|nr:nucleotide-binding protein [Methanomicrobiales archaeon]NYT20487.1 nucleotide-binding protein [Methanomicrobiales archaeon]
MKAVLDTSVFFSSLPLSGEIYTTPRVVAELRDLRSKVRFDLLSETGLQVREPGREAVTRVKEAAIRCGEGEVLSETDLEVLALAVELSAGILTDDYALQNAAYRMGVPVIPLHQKGARGFTWQYRCTGCGRSSAGPGECPVCGAPMKRRLK